MYLSDFIPNKIKIGVSLFEQYTASKWNLFF